MIMMRPATLSVPLVLLSAALLLLALASPAHASEPAPYGASTEDTPPVLEFPEDVVETWARVPVQQGGRAMPLYTWANYALLRLNHRRSCTTPDGRKLGPIEWLLTVMLRPEDGRRLDCFLIESTEITDAIGVSAEGKKKRDRYSYDDLAPGREKLFSLGEEYRGIEERNRSLTQGGIVALAHAVSEFEGVLHFLDFARKPVAIPASLRDTFDGAESAAFSEVIARANELVRADLARGGRGSGSQLVQMAAMSASRSGIFSILPPSLRQMEQIREAQARDLYPELDDEEWLKPWMAAMQAIQAPTIDVAPTHAEMLAELEALRFESAEDVPALREHSERFLALSRTMASEIGQYDRIEMEVDLLQRDPFGLALWLFVVAFVLVALSWALPNKYFVWAIWGFLALLVLWLSWWIGVRCIVRGRPPVVNLYDTILFITAFAVLASLVMELMNRQRIALAIAALFGIVGLFIAGRYEFLTKKDTMPQVVAVLDTNFWLTTHVTAISIGYSASLLTAGVAHVYVMAKVFGVKSTRFFQRLGGMVYGMLAFGMIFSVVGTILGGVWAAESWGRFWGWDPKENGALMIVLWQLAMLHGRLGGYIKTFGFSMASIALGPIVAFSWWGVNLLGIGLHSYGFTAGVWNGLLLYFAIEAFFLTVGGIWWIVNRSTSRPAAGVA